jgi:hypothetical protein
VLLFFGRGGGECRQNVGGWCWLKYVCDSMTADSSIAWLNSHHLQHLAV